MYKTGIFAGRFLPPHRGHLCAILHAATLCEKLYVVVSDNPSVSDLECKAYGLDIMDKKLRARWLSCALQGYSHIHIVMLDESGLPPYPVAWPHWIKRVKGVVGESIHASFTNESEYISLNESYWPEVATIVLDPERSLVPVSATDIRRDPLGHWEYLLPASYPFFTKRVLLTGTESCGKTTMAKYLAQLYDTSWSPETGRDYSTRHLGGNESVFIPQDFDMVAMEQSLADRAALQCAHRVVFFDGDAVLTRFYCQMYTGEISPGIERFIDPARYDLVLMFTPDVVWVDDGFRFNSDDTARRHLHDELLNSYIKYGFGPKLLTISGDYATRLAKCCDAVDELLRRGGKNGQV